VFVFLFSSRLYLFASQIITAELEGPLPLMYCGMDPVFHACLKMYITDVLSMPEVEDGE
jgi:hypothetical protein